MRACSMVTVNAKNDISQQLRPNDHALVVVNYRASNAKAG